ncbi:MAG TPA: DUF1232 domain-containing protein [Polyangiaceae bacterium]|nr:DUF1232 domain-containing protein [Polyangiaceae bacterium]
MSNLSRASLARPSRSSLAKVGRLSAVKRYFGDKDASFFGKAFVLFAVVYVVMPFDLIPEAIVPVLGWLDDVGVVALALAHLARVTAKYREVAELTATTG